MVEPERLLSVKEAATFMRKHEETFRRLVRAGKLPGPDWQPTPRSRFWRVSTLMGWGKKLTTRVTGLRRPKAVAGPVDPPVRPAVAGART